ncbi:hypothetical protein [Actinophytocola algeriensis]|uniref:DUF2269 domain-containing protein n=1 Tax=Actinophytocola algeriensis TaxID=1768010 RepID=A0A7W7VJ15_9PSEU|nr:hypothetical protein [Actinophytocola algeriensis]MBB4912147.1 hypothetical protein [Actinophytocola algeriensis]MBE1477361.1 hypothetical protein [Actinophytocola algeriensis]
MTTTERAATRRLTPAARKLLLLPHIVVSVGWLGLNVGNLTLAITGLTTDDPGTQHAALGAMYLIGGPLLIPVSLLALVSGVLLGMYTKWGLVRYRWVLVKLLLTVIAVVLIPLSLLPGLRELSALVAATPADRLADTGPLALDMLAAGIVSTSMYVTNAVLSVLKPWGRTRRVA